jgi:hypothetical protein
VKKLFREFSGRGISRDQCKDAGMAFTLLFILLGLFVGNDYFVFAAVGVLVLTMTAPRVCKPLAAIWFGLARVLGTIISKIVLGVVFFMIVTPVAVIRRLLNKDSLRLREFKKSRDSVMDKRNHTFEPMDIQKPF